jgi:outer membrane biosynthesis protein TonB
MAASTCFAALALAFSSSAQQPAHSDTTQQPDISAPTHAHWASLQEAGRINEAELKQLLVGKTLFLRNGYQDNLLSFDEHGRLIGNSPQGSFTLSAIHIDRVRLARHKVTMEGARYGLHFTALSAYVDPSKAFDQTRLTPNKKVVKITIDREMVVRARKEKEPKAGNEKNEKSKIFRHAKSAAPSAAPPAQVTPPQTAPEPEEMSEADQLKASIAATPAEERPADPNSVTTTTSPAHATRVLRDALEQVFVQGFDAQMIASLPDYWKLYYQAVDAKADYRPKDPAVLRQNRVDRKARLLTAIEPELNEYAQDNAVAGMALYHTVVGPDGKAGEVAVGRPIGFGLDENAIAAIRKASFQPAIKDGRPVPVLLDLVVEFHIFSKRTEVAGPPAPVDKQPEEPVLPGPYSVPR